MRFESRSHTATKSASPDLMTPGMSWLCAMRPSPIWPMRKRLFAPNALEGTMNGPTAAPRAAVLMILRREIMCAHSSMEGGGEYIRHARWSLRRRRGSVFPLFVTQRVDRIQPRRLARRVQAEADPDSRADGQRRHHDARLGLHHPAEFGRQQVPEAPADENSESATDGSEHQGLDEELRHDVAGLRTHGHADADLP